IGWLSLIGVARLRRGRGFALFTAIIVGVQSLVALCMLSAVEWLWPLSAYLQGAVYTHYLALNWPRMRPLPWRVLITYPALFFVSACVLGLPFVLLVPFGLGSVLVWASFGLAAIGCVQSLFTRRERLSLYLDEPDGRVERVDER